MRAVILASLVLVASISPSLAGGCLISLKKHEQRSGSMYKNLLVRVRWRRGRGNDPGDASVPAQDRA